ncbi:MAG: hypothetical protein ACP5SK_02255 [Thermoprotei archaeon]
MPIFKNKINSAGNAAQGASGGNQNPVGDASALKKAYETFTLNLSLAIPAVVFFVVEIIVVVIVMVVIAAALGLSIGLRSIYAYYGMLGAGLLALTLAATSALIEGILTGIFTSVTLVEANAALSSESFSFGAAMDQVKKKFNQILTFSVVLGIADFIWAFTGDVAWFLDGVTNMVFIVAFASILAGQGGRLADVLKRSVTNLMAWLGKDALSTLGLFVAAIFLGFPILEFAAMPMAALIVIIFYGGTKQAESSSQTNQQAGATQPPRSSFFFNGDLRH